MPIDLAQYSQPKPADEEGFIAEIVKSVKSIPHLPNAIARGLDEPGISPEERSLRARAMSEAAGLVIPAVFSGGGSLIFKAASNPILKMVITDAVGGAVGGGVAAGIEGGDPVMGAVGGGLTGGIFGAAGRGFVGSKAAAKEFADKAAVEAANIAKKKATQEAEAVFADASRKTAAVGDSRIRYNPATGQAEQVPGAIPNPIKPQGQLDLFGPQTGAVPPQGGQAELFSPVPPPADVLPGPRVAEAPTVSPTGKQPRGPNGRFVAAKQVASPDRPFTPIDDVQGTGQTRSLAPSGAASPRALTAATPTRQTAMEELIQAQPTLTPLEAVEEAAGMPKAGVHVTPDAAPPRLATTSTAFAPDQVVASGSLAGEAALAKGLSALKGKIPEGVAKVADEASMLFHRALSPARTLLHRMGPTGTALANQLDDIFIRWRRGAAEDIFQVEQALVGLTEKERVHVGEIMEGLAIPKDARALEAANKLEGIYTKYADELDAGEFKTMLSNGSHRDFISRKNYLTHYYDERTVKKYLTPGSSEHTHALRVLKEAYGYNASQATSFLRETLRLPGEFRTGPVNFARSNLLGGGYEKDPLKVMTRYIYNVRKRLEVAKDFGANYKGFDEVAKSIQAEAGDTAARAATRVFNAFNDKLPTDHKALVDALANFNAMTMLGVNAGFVQPAQLANTAAVAGYGNLIKAIGLAMRKEGQDWTRRVGGHIHETVQELAGTSKSPLMDFYMQKVIWLEPLDKVNRVVSSLAGKFYAEELGEQVAKKGLSPRLIEKLHAVGLDPAEVLAQGGKLTDDQLAMAAIRVSDRTQFASSVLDLPEMKNSQAGRLVYQFRSFALQQTQFLMREILGPAKTYLRSGGARGSLAPLARYASGIGAASYMLPPLLRGIKGRQPPDGEVEKAIENVALVGAFGIFGDTWTAMDGGKERILSMFVGPTGSELARAMGGAVQAAQGKPEALAKQTISKIPVIGPALVNYLLFPKD